ncbi:TonB-dependent receptor [Sphingomonas sp. S1-29]|uniref:TonB-dependent receptor n=1 Tax=Sphingomonas sp. S1-29 TaxID=2991074 RepID=UPI00224057F9|nr:TonB-dependent receptor [Sphingomonas sp. S1-29]UZK68105.1 TonB-dependent receptor [Sphingomonas sp. S1-29]
MQALALIGAGISASAMFAAPAAAQDFNNVAATGRVTTAAGAPVQGATVTVTSDDQGFSRTATTAADGAYRIPSLPIGTYTFEITAPNYATYREAGVRLTQNQSGNTFQLVDAGAAETTATADAGGEIVVTGSRVQVADFDRTTVGAVINVGELATRVPVGRDLNSIIQLAPGTTVGDTTFGSQSSIAGSSVSENAFFLNGLNITEFRQGLGSVPVPFDFYETIETKVGGQAAEYGRATGGFVNATTKSGSNEFHGSVTFNWEPDDLRSDSPNTVTADNDADRFERRDTIFQLSGPIIKDRLFFYGLYNARSVDQFAAGTAPIFNTQTGDLQQINGTIAQRTTTNSPFYGGKIDGIITDGHRVEFTYFNTTQTERVVTFGNAGSDPYDPVNNIVPGFDDSIDQFTGGENFIGRYTGQFTDWLTVSGAYGKYRNQNTTQSSRPDYPGIFDARSGTSISIGNPNQFIEANKDEREFYRGDVDVYVSLLGDHHFRAGYDRENLTSNASSSYTGNVAYTYLTAQPNDPLGVAPGTQYVEARTFVGGGIFNSTNEAFYIQDSWQLFSNRLTLNLGLRNDRFTNENLDGDEFYNSGDNWQPRLGFTADPFGDGRTKVYGTFSRYYLPIAVNTNIRLGGAELDYDSYFLLNSVNPDGTPNLGAAIQFPGGVACPDGGGLSCQFRNDGTVSPTDSIVAQNLENQSVDEYVVGIERRVGRRLRVGVFGVYRSLNASLEDAAIDAGINAYCAEQGISGCQDIWYGAHQYALFNPGNDVTIRLTDPLPGRTDRETITLTPDQLGYPKAERTYKAVTFEFEREFDGVWSLQGSYTYSQNEGNIEGGVKSDNGQTDSGLTTDFDFPSLALGANGPLPNDRNHSFKLFGSYQVFDWLNIGGNFVATSPRKFGCNGRTANSVSSPALINAGVNSDYGYAYGDAARFCYLNAEGGVITGTNDIAPGQDRELVPRGSQFNSDWLTNTNIDVSVILPDSLANATLRMSVFNLFNETAKLDFNENGTLTNGNPNPSYGQVVQYQAPRSVRFQLAVGF